MIRREQLVYTTDSSGAGTALSTRPVIGEILEVRQTAFGTATYTITRKATGGTIYAASGKVGPFTAYPRGIAVTTADAAAPSGTAIVAIPSNEHVQCVLASGPASTAGTVHILYREDC